MPSGIQLLGSRQVTSLSIEISIRNYLLYNLCLLQGEKVAPQSCQEIQSRHIYTRAIMLSKSQTMIVAEPFLVYNLQKRHNGNFN